VTYGACVTENEQAHLWLREALLLAAKNGAASPELAAFLRLRLVLRWGSKMHRALGTALYERQTEQAIISLSTVLWAVCPEAQKRETVFHELAHIIVSASRVHEGAQPSDGRRHHGSDWRRVMRAIGYSNPDVRHNVVNHKAEHSRGKVPLYCACKVGEPTYWVTRTKANRIAQYGSRCRKCAQHVQLKLTVQRGGFLRP